MASISWLATCEQIHQEAAAYRSPKNNCTFPVLSLSYVGLRGLAPFLRAYEHELVAGFTIVLAFSTMLLWLATDRLYRVTNANLRHAEQTAERQLRAYLAVVIRGAPPIKEEAKNCDLKPSRNLSIRDKRQPIRSAIGAEAAVIRPYGVAGEHEARNGLLLHRDIHSLLDAGYVTVTPDLHFEVSRRIREEFELEAEKELSC